MYVLGSLDSGGNIDTIRVSAPSLVSVRGAMPEHVSWRLGYIFAGNVGT